MTPHQLERLAASDDWFEIYRVTESLVLFTEPRHFEETIVSLRIGADRAVLIDTGCGIGDLAGAVRRMTDKPILVVNTHTHLDHIGGNHQFDQIALFDHPRSRRLAKEGAPREILLREILDPELISGPWPRGFDPETKRQPPFAVNRWLADGDRIELGDAALEVIHTPGEALDHICLLERGARVLFCGDILLDGPIWTHLAGGSLSGLIASYRRLLASWEDFDYLMPSHNRPWLDKSRLPESLDTAERVAAGRVRPEALVDPWGRRLNRYVHGRVEILTPRRPESRSGRLGSERA